jgi:glyoxylase-like metal-dependent hydrolase (beta-lactamase superfamily II)
LSLPAFLADLGHGVHAVDTGFLRDEFDAAYVVVERGRAAFIDTGTNFAVPRLLAALQALGLERAAVDYVIPTHVHLDHAGGVGVLMRELPQARCVVHPRGARHMVDPSQLYAGALAVYGQAEMDRSYGQLVPVPEDRVMTTSQGLVIELAGRPLLFHDTPGHARHHHCVWDAATRGWFTGDTFGLSYREFDTVRGAWMLPTSTPVQFDPEALVRSVHGLLALEPACMYLTHYGRVTGPSGVPALARQLLDLVDRLAALARPLRDAPDRHEALKRAQLALYAESLAAHGCTLPVAEIARLLEVDLELNAQGLEVWLDK